MLTQDKIFEIFEQAGVLLTGHFRLTSGRHSDRYMQCARIFQHPQYSEAICRHLAELFSDTQIDTVAGPAVGAIQMAYEVSRAVGCRNIFAERENGVMTFRRGFTIEPGERVLIVEDTVTTGGSVKEVIEAVKSMGGIVVGVGSVVDRSGGSADFGVPFRAAAAVSIESWSEENCPLCKSNTPIIKPGSRKI